MNKYLVKLVAQDLKNFDGFGIVKDSLDDNAWLIYSIEKIDPFLIRFKDYSFDVCISESDKLIQQKSFIDLREAVDFINKENK